MGTPHVYFRTAYTRFSRGSSVFRVVVLHLVPEVEKHYTVIATGEPAQALGDYLYSSVVMYIVQPLKYKSYSFSCV